MAIYPDLDTLSDLAELIQTRFPDDVLKTELAFQECASVAALDDDASHGDFPSCLMLFRTLQLPAMGLYHCEDASLSALKQACQPWPGLFVSRDGLTLTLPRPTPTDETYLL